MKTLRHRLIAGLLLAGLGACAVAPTLAPEPRAPLPAATAIEELRWFADQSLLRAPQPRQAITTQGLMFTDQAYVESQEAKLDWYRMLALALAAEHSGQSRYRLVFSDYLDAWLKLFQPSNDPISETDFQYLIFAVDRARGWLRPDQTQAVDRMFRQMAEGFLDRNRHRPGTSDNNWQSHRVKLACLLSFSLRDEALLKRCRGAFRRQIADNLRPDGRVRDFEQRDALRYVTYSLEPLLVVVLVARQHGQDWFPYQSPEGGSLNQSLRWLAEYAEGRRQHQEFVRTTVEFDRQRAAAGLAGFSGVWNPENAIRCYQLAARLNPEWQALAARLGPAPAWIEALFPAG